MLQSLGRSAIALLIAGGVVAASRPTRTAPPTLLEWRELVVDSLTPIEREALALAPALRPEQWGLRRADAAIDRVPVFFLAGKIGSGSGFGYEAAYGFAGSPLRLIWSSVTFEYVAPSDFVPDDWSPFVLLGCLSLGPADALSYVAVVDSMNPTARIALVTDTLVRPFASYGWAEGKHDLKQVAPLPESARAQCRAALAEEIAR
jgi:hypothetical protein